MYQLTKVPFGSFEKYKFHNDQTGNAFSVVPEHGACLIDLELNHKSVIDGYDKVEDMVANDWGKNIVLFPFPNRLRDGQYQFEGKTYQFPINEKETNTALHGFGMFTKMSVKEIDVNENAASITCLYEDLGNSPGYPFPFNFEISFTINNSNEFIVSMCAKNTGTQNLPIGIGWHPYFKLTDKVEELNLQFPACHKVEIDNKMIPTGVRIPYNTFNTLRPIKDTVLDNCFAMDDQKGRMNLTIANKEMTINYWQETGNGKFNYLQLFTPPYRTCLAIEPMTCNIDAFNNGDGLVRLKPTEELKGEFGLNWNLIQD